MAYPFADYPDASPMLITNPEWVFTDQNSHSAIVIHWTGVDATAEAIAFSFINDTVNHKSAHYVVGKDGTIVQVVLEKDGAGANCCIDATHDFYWNKFEGDNLNLHTISIEHVHSADITIPFPQVQLDASFKLVRYLLDKYHLTTNDIKPHRSINATDCPGNYPWSELMDNLQKQPTNLFQFDQEEIDTWNMSQLSPIPPMQTGIGQSWARAWRNYPHSIFGPPTSTEREVPYIKQGGNPVVVQQFAMARCEWIDGVGYWYDGRGLIGRF